MRISHPNLFVVGAPRAGTTRLYELFKAHPEISVCARKEPYYFSPEARHESMRMILKPIEHEVEYLALFEDKLEASYKAETSTTYCWDRRSPELIHAFNPEAKILFVLRDPIDRLLSHYQLHVHRYQERRPFIEFVNAGLSTNASAWDRHPVQSGFYTESINRYLQYFPASNVLVINFSRLNENLGEQLLEIQEFLSLSEPFSVIRAAEKVNAIYAFRSSEFEKLHRIRNRLIPAALPLPNIFKIWWKRSILAPIPDTQERNYITKIYRHDQERLKALCGWNFLNE